MLRYYITAVVGDGSHDNSYRPDLPAAYDWIDPENPVLIWSAKWSAEIPTDANGKPTKAWCLVAVEAIAEVHRDILETHGNVTRCEDGGAEVRTFLRTKGERNVSRSRQQVLELLHPGASLDNLRVSS